MKTIRFITLLLSIGAWAAAEHTQTVGDIEFTLSDGFHLDLVASEPDVRQPVYLSFDERGRMWVVQYMQFPFPAGLEVVGHDQYWRIQYDNYPPPAPPNHYKGRDKVSILEDRDGDGVFETAKDFVTGLNICTAALPGLGGVWVMNPPYLLFYPDANGDDIPDGDPEVHLAGFGLEDLHAVANSLRWGPDGWIYGCQGSTCWATVTRPGIDEEGIHFKGQAVWRYHPVTKNFELFAEGGYNNFGIAVDDAYRVFTGSNGGVIGVHYLQGAYYRKTWGKHGALTNPYAYGYFMQMEDHSSHPKMSQAMAFSNADTFAEPYRDKLFVARVLNRRIDMCELRPMGSTYSAHEMEAVLKTDNENFRPVDLKLGPDGAIYIADWYDTNVTWNVSAEGDRTDRETGRIYRLRYGDRQVVKPFDLRESHAEAILSTNRWTRETARRVRREATITDMPAGDSPEQGIEALWTAVHSDGTMDGASLVEGLTHENRDVRMWAVRLLGDDYDVTGDEAAALAALAGREPDPQVRTQLASTARRVGFTAGKPIVEALLAQPENADDPFIPLLLWWAVEGWMGNDSEETVAWIHERMASPTPIVENVILQRAAQRLTHSGHGELSTILLDDASDAHRHTILLGLAEGVSELQDETLPEGVAAHVEAHLAAKPEDPSRIELAMRLNHGPAIEKAFATVADAEADPGARASFIPFFAARRDDRLRPIVIELAQGDVDIALRRAATEALRGYSGDDIDPILVALAADPDGGVRNAALSIASGRTQSASAILESVDRGDTDPKTIPRDIAATMARATGGEGDRIVNQYWGAMHRTTLEKQAQINAVAAILKNAPGDSSKGIAVYEERCAQCHTFLERGREVGPDLTGVDRKNRNALLEAIINPSQFVLPEYLASEFVTREDDGLGETTQTFTGFLLSETDTQLTVTDSAGQEITIQRDRLVERRPLPQSIMPEGLLDGLTDSQLRDLFAYLGE